MSERKLQSASLWRGGWLWATLIVLAGMALLLRLGFWQLDRLQGRRAANALLLARMAEPEIVVNGTPLDAETADLRRAIIRGAYDYAQEAVLRNRTWNEQPGVHVLVPLRIEGSEVAILVDRGWIPYDMASPEQRSIFHASPGEVVVSGVLRKSQMRRSTLSPADPPLGPERPRLDAWFRVDLPRIQEQIPYPILSVYLEEDLTGSTEAHRFPIAVPDIELSEGSHLFYAIQWFSFAAILVVGYLFMFVQRAGRAGGTPEQK